MIHRLQTTEELTKMNKHTHLMIALLTLCMSLWSIPSQAADDKPSNKAKQRSTLADKIWWNQPKKISSLSLSESQRKQMDNLLNDYLKTHNKHVKKQQAAFSDLGDSLAKNQQKKTSKQRDKLAKTIADDVSEQIDMMSAVFALLSDEQRQLMAEQHPKLMSRLWVRTFRQAAIKSNQKGNRKKRQ